MDTLFKETLEQLEENRRKEWVGIPMGMGAMDVLVPFIERKRQILVFGTSGVGKSKVTTKKFLIDPYLFFKEVGYKLHIIYFSLEVPKIDVMTQVIATFYYDKFGEKHDKDFFARDKPSNAVMEKVAQLEEYFLHFSETVDIVDDIPNPTGLLKHVDRYYEKAGKIIKPTPYTSKYISNNDEHVIILTDTLNALHEEAGKSKFQTVFDYSLKYSKKRFVDFYGATAIEVQQQDKSTEQSEFTMKGGKIEYKTLPNRSGLAECKQTFNNADLVFSLYSPHLYSIAKYPFDAKEFYDITKWEDNFRIWNLQKNRHGRSSKEVALYFDGSVCEVKPIPLPGEFMKNPQLISRYI